MCLGVSWRLKVWCMSGIHSVSCVSHPFLGVCQRFVVSLQWCVYVYSGVYCISSPLVCMAWFLVLVCVLFV